MPFCPNCKYEYREGFTKCTDCGAELVDELPEEPPKEGSDFHDHPGMAVLENEIKLETFTEMVEFMYVASLLDEMDIPYQVRANSGDIIKKLYGLQPNMEKTIYVDDVDYARALEVLDSLDAYLVEGDTDDEKSDDYQD